MLAAGMATQFPATHELGHILSAKLYGKNIKFEKMGRWHFADNFSQEEKSITTVSGFIFPMIMSEIILDSRIPKDNAYSIGLVWGPLIHNLIYIIQDSTGAREDGTNDFEAMSKAGLKRNITYPLALIIPAIQVYRLSQDKEFGKKWNL